ncbi:MAG: hypothetical protein WBD37_06255 [Anderseniella sp.]
MQKFENVMFDFNHLLLIVPIMMRVLIAITTLLTAATPLFAEDAAMGKKVAIEHCRRCHVIPGENNMGVGNSPSFKAMIQSTAQDWRQKFEAFYALRPHPGFVIIQEFRTVPDFPLGVAPLVISLDDLDNLLAYVDTLALELRK